MRRVILGVILALVASSAHAGTAFCNGFQAGWEAAFRNHGKIVGITPICPIPPIGRDTFEGGYEMGMLRALQAMSDRSF